MGARKREMAERLKEERRQRAFAVLNNCPTSPRKMRLMADLIRGMEVNHALDVLRYSKKETSLRLEKLLKSAIANWEVKFEGEKKELETGNVHVTEIFVNEGRTLKRIQPAPQGRAHRIRKRSNHVTIVVGTKNQNVAEEK